MALTIQTLEHISLPDLQKGFNNGFSGYVIPIHMTESLLKYKILAENLLLEASVGVFEGKQLVGFVLHGLDTIDGKRVAYNGGTAVVPEFRGQGFPKQMYEYILPILKQKNVELVRLEVISENPRAIHVYKKLGFQITRSFDCVRGEMQFIKPYQPDVQVKSLTELPWEEVEEWWNFEPSWQNSSAAIRRSQEYYKVLGIWKKGVLVGYGIIQPLTGRISQFGIHPNEREQGLGKLLFYHLAKIGTGKLSILNIDSDDTITLKALKRMGFEVFTRQHEMEWKV